MSEKHQLVILDTARCGVFCITVECDVYDIRNAIDEWARRHGSLASNCDWIVWEGGVLNVPPVGHRGMRGVYKAREDGDWDLVAAFDPDVEQSEEWAKEVAEFLARDGESVMVCDVLRDGGLVQVLDGEQVKP